MHDPDLIMVKYINAREPEDYLSNGDNYSNLKLTKAQQTSVLKLNARPKGVFFTANGIDKNLLRYAGYMKWRRISDILPFDFDVNRDLLLKN